MQEKYQVRNGVVSPIQAPLVNESCLPPFEGPGMKSLTVYFKAPEEVIRKYLEPTPFDYLDNTCYAYVSDWLQATPSDGHTTGFYDSGIGITCSYKGKPGIHILFEYENFDYAIASGRELWGYPKKYASFTFHDTDDRVTASVAKNGVSLMYMEINRKKPLEAPIQKPVCYPHFQLRSIPNVDGDGWFMREIIARDPSPDFETLSYEEAEGVLYLDGANFNRLDEFGPLELLGATYTVGNAHVTLQTGFPVLQERIFSK